MRTLLTICALLFSSVILAEESRLVHALALHGSPKHPAGFTHFDYVNPMAAKGGVLVRGGFGSFDNFNSFIVQGEVADGTGLLYDTLTTKGMDEPFSEYGLLAERIEVPEGKIGWIIYHLHKTARFSDNKPVTAEDVVFSFNLLTTKGRPFLRAYYADVAKAEALDKHRVKFTFKSDDNAELPLILGQLTILPKHYWEGKDFTEVNLNKPIGSGPYIIEEFQAGRSVTYKRNPNYWGKNLAVNRGQHNFDRIKYIYYRDLTVLYEAFKAGDIDVWAENQAKRWHEGYNFPAVRAGQVIKKEFPHHRNQGMQAFIFNTRKDIFSSPLTRQALGYAFDFEWSNKNLFFNSYKRSYSFFSNSEMAAQGLPNKAELAILQPYREQLPAELFTQPPPSPPRTDTSGGMRANLRQAIALLDQAGWELKQNKLVSKETGKQMKFEILLVQKAFERIVNPFINNLQRLGIDASIRLVDTTQYINRVQNYEFDMMVSTIAQSESPGNEQRDFWNSKNADVPGGRNFIGVKSPVVDSLVEDLIRAESRQDLIDHCRALDRVLLWGYYVIPQWHISYDRLAYWNKFGVPAKTPQAGPQLSAWWSL